MPKVVMDALSHQAIRHLGSEAEHYRQPSERSGRWTGKRLVGVERSLVEAGHVLAFERPTAEALADAAILVVASRSQSLLFQTHELAAIRDFVLRGGGLLLMANHQQFIMPQQQVALALNLPLGFIDGTIAGFPPIVVSPHPVTDGVDQLVVRNSTSMVMRAPAVAVAHFAVDPRHRFAVAVETAGGRVLATGDSGFIASSDDTGRDMFASGANASFFANAIRWLSRA